MITGHTITATVGGSVTNFTTKDSKRKLRYLKPELKQLGLIAELTQAGGVSKNEAANDPLCDTKPYTFNKNCVGAP
jgi:hypothetical protein